ncbi:MAG: zinc-ribbon domain-containing protein [Alphaproteobacteria bacterium GM7ARS4]|nr:zinc-ribbon domain-containing protein [Alphaproteobacteria bacterium GM7ARS4]
MIVCCPSCGTQYSVLSYLIPKKGRLARCSHCGYVMTIYPAVTASPDPDAQQGAKPLPESASLVPLGMKRDGDKEDTDHARNRPAQGPLSQYRQAQKRQRKPAIIPVAMALLIACAFFIASVYYALIYPCYEQATLTNHVISCSFLHGRGQR